MFVTNQASARTSARYLMWIYAVLCGLGGSKNVKIPGKSAYLQNPDSLEQTRNRGKNIVFFTKNLTAHAMRYAI
jgi:hypothetical protein